MSSTTEANASHESLDGQTALISGASRGIGLECARALHRDGARLVLLGRDLEALEAIGTELGSRTTVFSVDLGVSDIIDTVLRKIRSRMHGAPDIIINNAGHFLLAPAERTEVEAFERTMRVNLIAPFAIVRAFLADMKQRSRGHIVTIGSIADHQALPGNVAYAASKFGVRGLHEVLRAELRGTGVRTTLVSPGPVDTTMWDEVNPDERPGFTPRAQMLRPAAVADAVRYAITRAADVNVDELRLSRA